MSNHANRRRSVGMKTFVAMLALVLVIGCAVGGTVAWLVSSTNAVVNTFTYGDINITLGETTGSDYTIIPGVNIDKNPKVTSRRIPKPAGCSSRLRKKVRLLPIR